MFDVISVIGLGYIGLPTAAMFASRKKKVIGVDISNHAVDTINNGGIHIVEPELDVLVKEAVTSGYLQASLTPKAAEAFLIAVPTPFTEGHQPDLSFIQSAAKSIAPILKKGDLIILESTSPVGTTDRLATWFAELRPDLSFPQQVGEDADIHLAYCPERVLPGKVVHELVSNDRIVGGMTRRACEMAVNLYKIFVKAECIVTSSRTAEMCKLTENSFRDVNIAFANEVSMICWQLGVDASELIGLANRHPRVNILQPGVGVGGHCIAVDPWFIVDSAPESSNLIKTARQVNDLKPLWVIDRVKESVDKILATSDGLTKSDVKIACLGITFKPDIDDIRESPALTVVSSLVDEGYRVLVVEPNLKELPDFLVDKVGHYKNVVEDIGSADIVCFLVKHRDFCDLGKEKISGEVLDFVGLNF
ncbi:MAG: UDP-N-acetyl-D-mannosamine dehydrogenase [Oligoflexus sp.]